MPCFLLTFSKINSTAPPFLMPGVSSRIPSRLIGKYSVFYVLCQSSARYVSAANTVCNNVYVLTLMLMVFSYTHLHIYIYYSVFYCIFCIFFVNCTVLYYTVSTYMYSFVLLTVQSVETLIRSRTYRYQSPVLLSVTLCVITRGLFRFSLLGVSICGLLCDVFVLSLSSFCN